MHTKKVTIAGVSTDLAVQSADRDAHGLDIEVEIAVSCCAAASNSDHQNALDNMSKFASVTS